MGEDVAGQPAQGHAPPAARLSIDSNVSSLGTIPHLPATTSATSQISLASLTTPNNAASVKKVTILDQQAANNKVNSGSGSGGLLGVKPIGIPNMNSQSAGVAVDQNAGAAQQGGLQNGGWGVQTRGGFKFSTRPQLNTTSLNLLAGAGAAPGGSGSKSASPVDPASAAYKLNITTPKGTDVSRAVEGSDGSGGKAKAGLLNAVVNGTAGKSAGPPTVGKSNISSVGKASSSVFVRAMDDSVRKTDDGRSPPRGNEDDDFELGPESVRSVNQCENSYITSDAGEDGEDQDADALDDVGPEAYSDVHHKKNVTHGRGGWVSHRE